MGRTNSLRRVIAERLKTVCANVYYEMADERAMYPHIVFEFGDIDTGDQNRHDITVDVNIWDRSASAKRVEDMADGVEDVFKSVNLPQKDILPTCYLIGRQAVPDEDKSIRHRLIRMVVQNYEREADSGKV